MLALLVTLIDDNSDKERFAALFEKYKSRVYAIAFRFLGNEALAEEAAQDTFFFLARNFSLVKSLKPSQLDFYITIAAKNTALSALRKEKRHLESAELREDLLDDKSMSAYDRAELRSALEALDYEDREVLYLHYVMGLDYKSVGRTLTISAAAARKRAQYARARLKQLLKGEDQ